MELIFQCINAERENKGGTQGSLWAHLRLELPHCIFVAMCAVTGVEDVTPAKAHPEKMRRKLNAMPMDGPLCSITSVLWDSCLLCCSQKLSQPHACVVFTSYFPLDAYDL